MLPALAVHGDEVMKGKSGVTIGQLDGLPGGGVIKEVIDV